MQCARARRERKNVYRQEVSALRRDLSSAANAQRGFNGTMKDMRSAFVQATASYTAFAGLNYITCF